MMIDFKHSGNFKNMEALLNKKTDLIAILNKYGKEGVNALSLATPSDSGLTSTSWYYTVKTSRGSFSISWSNSNIVNGIPVAILIQYGHATRNGSYIQGQDFINPIMQPIFDKITKEVVKI